MELLSKVHRLRYRAKCVLYFRPDDKTYLIICALDIGYVEIN